MVSEEQKQALIEAATAVRERAYAPYSGYQVGAAVLAADGRVFTGVNVENASYGLTNCAERTAVYKMVTAGQRRLLAVAICTEDRGSPCGACRQVLAEFGGDVPVWLCDAEGQVVEKTLVGLLPDHFGPGNLL